MSTITSAYGAAMNYKVSAGSSSPSQVSGAVPSKDGAVVRSQGGGAKAAGGGAVIVTLSAQAQTVVAAGAGSAKSAAQVKGVGTAPSGPGAAFLRYFPTRDGTPATALADAVADPGKAGNSAGMTQDEVAKDARARMDAVYKSMADSGQPFDYNSFEGRDWNSLMAGLDRRSLNAVRSDVGGQFTKQEQEIAGNLMQQQQGLATGLYNGPISQEGSFTDPFNGDHPARFKAAAAFLDKVSDEEKTTIPWAVNRASAQLSHQWLASERGDPNGEVTSDHPLVNVLVAAMDTMRTGNKSRGITRGALDSLDGLKAQPWFQGFESQFDEAMRKTREKYQAAESSEAGAPAKTAAAR